MQLHSVEKGAGEPLLLLHGNFGDIADWQPVFDTLAHRFRVIALDLPGCGRSEKPDAAYDASMFVAALEAFFREKDIGRCAIVGHSLGGQIALAFALAHPELVTRLVLVDSGGFHSYSEQQVAMLQPRFAEAVLAAMSPEQARFIFSSLFVQLGPEAQDYVEKQVEKTRRDDWPDVARMAARSFDFHVTFCATPLLDRITCPLLLVWGDQDRVVPVALVQSLMSQMSAAELRIIANCGHAPQIEKPAEFLSTVEPFLQ